MPRILVLGHFVYRVSLSFLLIYCFGPWFWPSPHYKPNPESPCITGMPVKEPHTPIRVLHPAWLTHLTPEMRPRQPPRDTPASSSTLPCFPLAPSNAPQTRLLPQIPQQRCSPACEPLCSLSPRTVFSWVKDLKLASKLSYHFLSSAALPGLPRGVLLPTPLTAQAAVCSLPCAPKCFSRYISGWVFTRKALQGLELLKILPRVTVWLKIKLKAVGKGKAELSVNALQASELYAETWWKWSILCYTDFSTIKRSN